MRLQIWSRRLRQQECRALGLVDRHTLTGAVEFWAAGRRAGVRPILGLELEIRHANLGAYAAGPGCRGKRLGKFMPTSAVR